MTRDPDFGPIVHIASGGIHGEVMKDVRHALPPFGPPTARRLIDDLALRALLDAQGGRPAADVDALALALSRFSVLCASLGDLVDVIHVNPVIAGPCGCIAADLAVSPLTAD
jgi:acetyltransferase